MKKRLFALALSVSMIMAQVTPTFAVNLKSTEALDTEIETVEAQTEETEIQTESLEETVEVEDTVTVEETESETVEAEENSVDTYAADDLVATLANNEVSSATSVNVNTTYTDNLVNSDDVNWYQFTISSVGYISLEFTHEYIESGSRYWKAHLYNSEQKELTWYSFYGNQTSYTQGKIGLPSGTYYMKVERDNTSDKEYNFKINYTASDVWETEFNDDIATTDSINVNTTYYGSLMDGDDVDWYQFNVSKAGYISLNFQHDYMESDWGYWRARLYNYEQKELTNYLFNGDKTNCTQGEIGLPAGTYYMKIERDNTSDITYNFKINYTASDVWETEFNDDAATADQIAVNTTYYGSLMDRDDVDWYQFNVSKAGYISLNFKHDYMESDWGYWRARLYNHEQKELTNYLFNGDKTNCTQGKIGVPAGTYYMKIERDNTSDITYNFKINYTASDVWETEFNDDAATADQIAVNTTYYGSLMDRDDVDWYQFNVSKAGYISLNFKHDYMESDWGYWRARLYNHEQKELTNYLFNGDKTNCTQGKIGVPAGTYYMKIERDNTSDKTYNFKINFMASSVWEKEFNDDYTTADKISYGKTYYGSLMDGDDVDWYKFDISSGGNKTFYFKHDAVTENSNWTYWRVHLYNASMSEVWNHSSSGSETSYSEKIKLSAGTYYLKIEDYDYSDKTYNFQISGVVSKPGKATLKKSTNDSNGNIKVNWEKVKDANGYYIYKKDKDSNYKKVADVASDKTSYIDKSGSIGSKYTYTVRAYKKSGDQYILGDYDKNGVNGQKIPAKVILATIKNNSKGQVNLTWEKVSGIDGYRVYRKASGEGWKKLKDVTATSITDTSAKIGVTYSYTVRAYKKINGNLVQGSYDSKGFSGKRVPPTVQLVSAKYQKDKGVVVNWKKTDDCSGYVIYRKDTKSGWTRLAKVSGKDNVKYTDKVRSNINTYKYTVRAYQTVNAKEILGGYDKSGVSVTK